MNQALCTEQAENLRRIAERGLALAQKKALEFVDIFQHLLDEITRLKKELSNG